MTSSFSSLPIGAGLGLRWELHQDALAAPHSVAFWEVHPENYISNRANRDVLLRVAESGTPVSLHGVSMNLGGVDLFDHKHIEHVRALAEETGASAVSEHLAWTHANAVYLNDLLPVPLSHESLINFVDRVDEAQNALGRTLLIENPSTYMQFPGADYSEVDFIAELAKRSGCGLLLDVNNVYVSCHNHGWDIGHYMTVFPMDRVGEIHIAGHSREQVDDRVMLIDTHDQSVVDDVWALLDKAIALAGPRPVLVERDGNIPPIAELLDETARVDSTLARQLCAA